jgi:hypothetical protein
VLLLVDPVQPEQERQLEQLYLRFAQPSSLTMKQCMVLGLSVARGAEAGAAGWSGGWRVCPAMYNTLAQERSGSCSTWLVGVWAAHTDKAACCLQAQGHSTAAGFSGLLSC